jgi:hypothetical protein
MSLAYNTNCLLRHFGYQLVRNKTLAKLQVPPPPAAPQPEVANQRFWDLEQTPKRLNRFLRRRGVV